VSEAQSCHSSGQSGAVEKAGLVLSRIGACLGMGENGGSQGEAKEGGNWDRMRRNDLALLVRDVW